ncbi:putative ribonuclease H-like domain-containing protein [Tanacetum coccineum]
MTDAKEMWEAIKSRFGGNDESKKMQKYILKQQFKSFSVSNLEELHKGYDRFQSLLSQLEIHSACVSTEDANQKFLRSLNLLPCPQSPYKRDHARVDKFDLEEMDLKWQVAMISMRLKKFYKNTGRKLEFDAKVPIGFDKTKVECFNCHNIWHFAKKCRSKGNQESKKRDAGNTRYKAKDNGRRPGKQEEPKALVTINGDGVDWTGHAKDEQENFALMAYNNSGSNTEVTSCLKECEESYTKLKKLYDEQREQLGDASIEIQAYTQTLKKVEAQLVCHQQNQLVYEEKIRFMKIDLDDKTNVLTYHKKLLAEAVKEKEELKTKLENFQSSSKGVLSYENEVLESVFDSRSSDVEDTPVYDRFAKVERMHVVPLPMIGIYMPPKSDFGIDESNFTYGPKQSKTSEFAANTSDSVSCESNYYIETLEFLCLNRTSYNGTHNLSVKPKSKFGFDAPYHEEETVKEQNTCSPSPKADKRDWNGLMSKKLGLGYGFTKKACFNGKGTGQWENRLVWNNVQILNHQNKFVPKVVLTKTDIFPVNTARQNLSSQAAATSTARKVNTARPIINEIIPRNNFYKSHSPIRRLSSRTTTPKENFANHKVNTVRDKIVSAVGGNRETTVKASAGCNWRSKRHYWNKVSKYNSGSNSSKNDDPQKALKNKGIVDSGCSRHMTGNKAYLVEYQDYNGGPVAFGRSKGQITGKGKIITGKLDFKDVYFVKELKQFNLFSMSQMCDKKNKVLFTDSECLVLSPDFKLPDENQVLLRVSRENNMYSFNLENIVPTGGLACLIAKATVDEYNKWIKREYSNARTPQQNGVAKRKNITLIEAARTMLVDSFLPNTFWVEAVSTSCMSVIANKTACPKEAKHSAGAQDNIDIGNSKMEVEPAQEYFVLPLWSSYTLTVKSSEAKNGDEKPNGDTDPKTNVEPKDQEDQAFLEEIERIKRQEK